MNDYSQLEKQKETTLQIAAGLDEIADIVGLQLGLHTQMEGLRRRAEALRNGRFKIVVIGAFNRGKSTLLNAVLGRGILPQSWTPSTAIISVIEYADEPRVRVKFLDGAREDEVLSLEEFRERYVLNEDDWAEGRTVTDRFTAVDLAIVSYPVELCRQHVELVDSPGLEDDPVRTKRTVEFLKQADAVVMVLDATALLTENEERFLQNELKQHGLKNIFFAINKWNVLKHMKRRSQDADREFAKLEARIRDRLTPFCIVHGIDVSGERVFRINALGALEAREQQPVDEAALAESKVPAFEQAVQRFLVEGRGRARLDVVLAALKAIDQEVLRFIATQVALSDKSVGEIEAERVALEPKLERLRGIQRHIENFLETQSINLQDRLVLAFQAELDKIVEELPEAMDQFELNQLTGGSMLWKAVTDWFRDDDQKFKAKVERHLTPRVTNYLQGRFARVSARGPRD